MDEKHVLCVPAASAPADAANPWLYLDARRLVAGGTMRPRTPELEEDPTWLQLVAYVCCWRQRNGDRIEVLAHRRKNGDARLQGSWSLALGGHVEGRDVHLGGDALLNAARRELQEELGGFGHEPEFAGLLRTTERPVDLVHLGAVFLAQVAADAAPQPSEADEWEWVDPFVDDDRGWEPWSAALRRRWQGAWREKFQRHGPLNASLTASTSIEALRQAWRENRKLALCVQVSVPQSAEWVRRLEPTFIADPDTRCLERIDIGVDCPPPMAARPRRAFWDWEPSRLELLSAAWDWSETLRRPDSQ